MFRYFFVLATSLSLACVSLNADVVSVTSLTVGMGSTFDLPVTITGSSDLYAFQFDVAYNPSLLQLVSINEGAFLPTAGSTFFIPGSIDNVAGNAVFTVDTLLGPGPGAAGSGTLATLDFQAIGLGNGAVSLSNVVLLDSNLNDIAFTANNGLVSAVPEPRTLIPVACGLLLIGLASPLKRELQSRLRKI